MQQIDALPSDKHEGKSLHDVILGRATYDWENKRMGAREMLAYAELRNDMDSDFTGRMF